MLIVRRVLTKAVDSVFARNERVINNGCLYRHCAAAMHTRRIDLPFRKSSCPASRFTPVYSVGVTFVLLTFGTTVLECQECLNCLLQVHYLSPALKRRLTDNPSFSRGLMLAVGFSRHFGNSSTNASAMTTVVI